MKCVRRPALPRRITGRCDCSCSTRRWRNGNGRDADSATDRGDDQTSIAAGAAERETTVIDHYWIGGSSGERGIGDRTIDVAIEMVMGAVGVLRKVDLLAMTAITGGSFTMTV